jgi:hypothetical protein
MLLDAIGLLILGAMEQAQEQRGAQMQKPLAGVIIIISSQKIAGNILLQGVVMESPDALGKLILILNPIAKLIGVQIVG